MFVEPEGYDETVNIFEARNLYVCLPMLTVEYSHFCYQNLNLNTHHTLFQDEPQNAKKKNDDVGKDPKWIMGLIEMDMMLLTKQESDQEPAGKKRSEPNHVRRICFCKYNIICSFPESIPREAEPENLG